ncbi:MAG: alkaline phosphatase D family protein [Burkholderiales bacterium]
MRYIVLFFVVTVVHVAGLASAQSLRSGPMAGFTDMQSTTIWLQTDAPGLVELTYWPRRQGPSISRVHQLQTLGLASNTAHMQLQGLAPGEIYDTSLSIDGKDVLAPGAFSFATPALWQYREAPPAFTFLAGSCHFTNDPEPDRPGPGFGAGYEIFGAMAQMKPAATLWLGDNIYLRETDWHSAVGIDNRYKKSRALPALQALLRTGQHWATWDDHDFGPNDANSSYPLADESRALFKRYWANRSYGSSQLPGIQTVMSLHDVDVFMLDNRSFRDDAFKGRPAERRQFGDEQMRWLRNALANSRAPIKIIASGGQFLNEINPWEGWHWYPKERADFLKWLEDESIAGVLFLSGDRHHSVLMHTQGEKGYAYWELTCSPLTAGTFPARQEDLNNPMTQPGTLVTQRNFCAIHVEGAAKDRRLRLQVRASDGALLWERALTVTQLGAQTHKPTSK